jgi:hypothetical protein
MPMGSIETAAPSVCPHSKGRDARWHECGRPCLCVLSGADMQRPGSTQVVQHGTESLTYARCTSAALALQAAASCIAGLSLQSFPFLGKTLVGEAASMGLFAILS